MDDFLKSISRTLHMKETELNILIEVLKKLNVDFQIINDEWTRSIIVLLPRRLRFSEQGSYISEAADERL